jgi:hypothetical protein
MRWSGILGLCTVVGLESLSVVSAPITPEEAAGASHQAAFRRRVAARPGARSPASAGPVRRRHRPAPEALALIDRINDRYGRCSIGFGLFPERRARVQGARRLSPGAGKVGVLAKQPTAPRRSLPLTAPETMLPRAQIFTCRQDSRGSTM